MSQFQIVCVDKPEESAWGIIGQGIDSFNNEQAGDYQFKRICVVLQGEDQVVAGGAIGEMFWGWFNLSLMWVKDELRGKGYGQQLLVRIEEEAKQHGAKHIFLDTFSFQAPEFYKKFGYRVFGELSEFPAGHVRYYMVKDM